MELWSSSSIYLVDYSKIDKLLKLRGWKYLQANCLAQLLRCDLFSFLLASTRNQTELGMLISDHLHVPVQVVLYNLYMAVFAAATRIRNIGLFGTDNLRVSNPNIIHILQKLQTSWGIGTSIKILWNSAVSIANNMNDQVTSDKLLQIHTNRFNLISFMNHLKWSISPNLMSVGTSSKASFSSDFWFSSGITWSKRSSILYDLFIFILIIYSAVPYKSSPYKSSKRKKFPISRRIFEDLSDDL